MSEQHEPATPKMGGPPKLCEGCGRDMRNCWQPPCLEWAGVLLCGVCLGKALLHAAKAAAKKADKPKAARPATVNEDDPVEFVSYLDQNPTQRYEFIRKHGREKFFELLRTAKRRGYKRPAQ